MDAEPEMRSGGCGVFLCDANAEASSTVMIWGRQRTRQFYAASARLCSSFKKERKKKRKKESVMGKRGKESTKGMIRERKINENWGG